MTAVTPIAITTTIAKAIEIFRRFALVERADISAPA
jgi:hypothetical protein